MSDPQHAQLLALAPPGGAFPRDPASTWGRALRPLAEEHGRLEAAGDALRLEVDPGLAPLLLADYERVLGDDPCLGPAAEMPLVVRQSVARQRWTARGGASRDFFIGLADALGLNIQIIESEPFECGLSECGAELVPASGRFEWIVRVVGAFLALEEGGLLLTEGGERLLKEDALGVLVNFETGVAEAGTSLGELPRVDVLECVIRRRAPAHTTVYFAYGS